MGGGEPAGVRHIPYSDAVSWDAAVPPDGSGGPSAASRLDALRHGARRVSSEAHDPGRAGARLCVDLRAAVLAPVDLAAAAAGLAGGANVPGNVVFIQAVELVLALVDQAPLGARGVAAVGGVDARAASAFQGAPGGAGYCRVRRKCRDQRSVTLHRRRFSIRLG